MKKIGYIAMLVLATLIISKIIDIAQNSPEKVTDIVKHWSIAWFKGGIITLIVISIIFLINKKFSNERTMSIIGMITMPILIPSLLYFCFGYILWLCLLGILAGLIIGYFSYIIDDHLLEVWKIRHTVLPLLFGLGFGGSTIVAALTENWQDEYLYVSDYATCHQLELQKYTYHYRSSKHGGSYHSWDTYKTLDFFNRGEQFAMPQEGIDYTLGSGAYGKTDRVNHYFHKWIGGDKLTRSGAARGFKWIYLNDPELKYEHNAVSEVEENFFGHALKNGKQTDMVTPENAVTQQALPTDDDIPGIFSMSFDFFKIMFTNPDFALLRWIYLLIYLPFIAGALFIPELRIGLFIFFISSSIILLIIIAAAAARSGRDLEDFTPSFGGFGGGGFGGGGAGRQW